MRLDTWLKDDTMNVAFRQMLHNVTCHDWGWETKPNNGAVVPGTIGTSSATISVPAEPAQSNLEKLGSASPLTGDRGTNTVHAMRPTLNDACRPVLL